MSENLPCTNEGCEHPYSIHTMRRADKRDLLRGTRTMRSDFPSGRREQFNIYSGRADDDACSEPGCKCIAYARR